MYMSMGAHIHTCNVCVCVCVCNIFTSFSCYQLQDTHNPGGSARDLLVQLDELALALRDNVTLNLTDISEQCVCVHCCACSYLL